MYFGRGIRSNFFVLAGEFSGEKDAASNSNELGARRDQVDSLKNANATRIRAEIIAGTGNAPLRVAQAEYSRSAEAHWVDVKIIRRLVATWVNYVVGKSEGSNVILDRGGLICFY